MNWRGLIKIYNFVDSNLAVILVRPLLDDKLKQNFSIFRIEDEWTFLNQIRPTKRVKVSSLPYASRIALVAHLFDKRIDTSNKVRRGRKTKPQPRATAVS